MLRNLASLGAPALAEDALRAPRDEMRSAENRRLHAPNVRQPEPSALTVEVASGARLSELHSDWEDLLARGDGDDSMDATASTAEAPRARSLYPASRALRTPC